MAYSKASIVVLITTVLSTLPAGYGQVFRVQGGTSTLLDAQGGSVDFKAPNYSGNFGLGFYNGSFQIGAVARSQVHGYNLTAGDDSILFDLPTDWFDGTHYFLARDSGFRALPATAVFVSLVGQVPPASPQDSFRRRAATMQPHYFSITIV